MDPSPILDGVVAVVQQNPGTAGVLSALALLPYVARIAYQLTKRKHSTWLSSALGALARWPGPRT